MADSEPRYASIVSWRFQDNDKVTTLGIADEGLVRDGAELVAVDSLAAPMAPAEDESMSWSTFIAVVRGWEQLRSVGKGRSPRRLLRLVSELQWPGENAFVREKFALGRCVYLETHFSASASLPMFGRLYVVCDRLLFHQSGVWSETKWVVSWSSISDIQWEGRTLRILAGNVTYELTVVLADLCRRQLDAVWTKFKSTVVFGVPLHELQSRHNCVVPRLLMQCVEYLRVHGMCEEGLFRVPGAHSKLEKWAMIVDQGFVPRLEDGSVHDTASLLKRFIMSIPEHLIQDKLWESITAQKDLSRDALRATFKEHTTPEWRQVAHYLFRFLGDVARNSEVNKMGVDNIAMVFCPVMRDAELNEYQALSKLVVCCIQDEPILFAL